MPYVSGNVGAVFNGGTITLPMTIDLSASDGTHVPLTIRASYNAQTDDFFAVTNSDAGGLRLLSVDSGGITNVGGPTSALSGELEVWGTGGFVNEVLHATATSVHVGAGTTNLDSVPAVALLPNLPAADPHIAGQLFTVVGVLHVSAG